MRTIHNFSVQSTIPKGVLLKKLRANRASHAAIVKESRKGYLDKAQKALLAKIKELKAGRLVSLHFSLHPPSDHTEAYDTVIQMLDISTDEHIVLTAADFRQLVMDEWEWKDDFLIANRGYSVSALTEADSKGL